MNFFAVILVLSVIVTIPFIQALFFTQQTKGKIEINEVIDAQYLAISKKEYTLVFFGYVGCAHVCTPVLKNLSDFYGSTAFSTLRPFVDLTFINLRPEVEPNQPEVFAKSFNTNFKGVYLTRKQLMSIDKELNVYFSKQLGNTSELDHSDHIYLVKHERNGTLTLKNIYTTHPFNAKVVIHDLTEFIKGVH